MFKSVLILAILAFGAYSQCDWGNASFDNPSYCNQCDDLSECTDCMLHMDFYLDAGNCCPYNYATGSSGTCEICPSYCIGCEDPSSFICTGCHAEMEFSNGMGPGECVPLQPNRYGTQPNLICAAGYTLYGNHMCLQDESYTGELPEYDYCIDGYYYNYEQGRCLLCMENLDQDYENACTKCGNRGDEVNTNYGCDCCINDYFPVGPHGYCCPFNYRYDETDPTGCNTCHPTCAQCQGPSEYDCVTCFPGTQFINGVSPGQCSVNDGSTSTFQCADGWTLYKDYLCVRDDWDYAELTNEVCDASFQPGATVYGCTDASAINYNPAATNSDGSCQYTTVDGCTNPNATNYNPDANNDDGSCTFDNWCANFDQQCYDITYSVHKDDGDSICTWEGTADSSMTMNQDGTFVLNMVFHDDLSLTYNQTTEVGGCGDMPEEENYAKTGHCDNETHQVVFDGYGAREISSNFELMKQHDQFTTMDYKFTSGECAQWCDDSVLDSEYVVFCRDCNYRGEMLVIMDEADCLEWSPASVHVPRGKQVRVFDECLFDGQVATFTEGDVSCIADIDFQMLANFGITLNGKKNSLKVNKAIKKDIKVEVSDL